MQKRFEVTQLKSALCTVSNRSVTGSVLTLQ